MSAHILVFDSGLGGTTVLRELGRQLPDCRYSYALDNAVFPYGDKPADFLAERVCWLMGELLSVADPDLVVIACNTASTQLLAVLREVYALPFVGVVPAIKPAAARSDNRCIGLLATPATVGGSYVAQLQRQFAADCELLSLSAQGLVMLAECKMLQGVVDMAALQRCLQPLWSQPGAERMDVLILGCTHFPVLHDEIMQLWPYPIRIVDSGVAIASRVAALVDAGAVPQSRSAAPAACLYTTSKQGLALMMAYVQNFAIDRHRLIALQ